MQHLFCLANRLKPEERSPRRLLSKFPPKESFSMTARPTNSWKMFPYTGMCRAEQAFTEKCPVNGAVAFPNLQRPFLCDLCGVWVYLQSSSCAVSLTWHLWLAEYPTAQWTNCMIKCLPILLKTPSMGLWSVTPTSAPRGKWWVFVSVLQYNRSDV